ncbi:cation/H(+) antiporter 15-like [Abrus precatorius]|uniref:Cation/H(+) antiporter 15-like n=1 Tax=Abrus precatorius TaxID=3816 RepID=A0A8B8MIQ4_ABRPR|nr:cation/H(+) antiporter 15-like [Abrus precatorius]
MHTLPLGLRPNSAADTHAEGSDEEDEAYTSIVPNREVEWKQNNTESDYPDFDEDGDDKESEDEEVDEDSYLSSPMIEKHPFEESLFMRALDITSMQALEFLEYANLEMCDVVRGSIVQLDVVKAYHNDELVPDVQILRHIFWSFAPCIRAFRYCKPLVQVDGTHLYGKYKGALLVAVAQDDNQNILLIGFAIVEGKTADDWQFFLENLCKHVVTQDGVGIISDRHKSINAAIRRSNRQWEPPKAFHMYCIRHIAANFLQRFKTPYLHKLIICIDSGGDISYSSTKNCCCWGNTGQFPFLVMYADIVVLTLSPNHYSLGWISKTSPSEYKWKYYWFTSVSSCDMALVNISSRIPIYANRSIWECENATKFQRSKGVFYGDNPLDYILSLVILQIAIVSLLTSWLQFLLIPLGEGSFVPQVLAGLIAGPSVLGNAESVRKWLFPKKSFYVSETIAFFGSIMYMFMIGIKLDLPLLLRAGKRTWAIGICSSLMPVILSTLVAFILRKTLSPDQALHKSLIYISCFLSSSSFHVTACLLADLKLLNSEVGRLALSSAVVSGLVSSMGVTFIISQQQTSLRKEDDNSFNLMIISLIVMVVFIVCLLRPIMLWMIRQTPQGKPIKESYIVSVFLMLLVCSLLGELIGEHFLMGPVLLGMAVPEGPPLGSALIERLDTMVSVVFMPLYFLFTGARCKLYTIDAQSFVIVQLVAIISCFGKVIGTILPSIYCKIPMTDALSLGLILSANGITQLIYIQSCLYLGIIDEQSYSNMVVAILLITGVVTPTVKFLYDPSKRYLSLNRRRTIEHSSPNAELRLMACIHHQENTPPIINVLEMSNSSIESPICFYVLHLIQLKGRSAPLFIDHQPSNKANSSHSSHSQKIINAFKSYEQQNIGKVVVNLFTSISPYETMHDEICMQAAEKRACMVIMPFHKQWTSSGMTESAHPIRALNRHLLRTAPCSVGILIERENLIRNNPLTCVTFYSVGIVFIEGPDDREALAYAMRMADHPNVRVTVIRLIEPRKKNRNFINRDPDGDLIHKFKIDYIQVKRHDYREEIVRDSVEMISIIRTLEGCFDLILVGRRHESESLLFRGLTEWNEYPELGPVGDVLVSSDSTFDGSVLVVQQQNRVGVGHHDLHLDNSTYSKHQHLTIVEVPRSKMVWPIV